MKQVSQAKDSRIDLRVTKEQKALLEKAAFLKGISLSAYTLSHLLLIAKQEIEEQEKLILSDRFFSRINYCAIDNISQYSQLP